MQNDDEDDNDKINLERLRGFGEPPLNAERAAADQRAAADAAATAAAAAAQRAAAPAAAPAAPAATRRCSCITLPRCFYQAGQ